jgi:HAD superfamily hydrolase (TIGR01484 family)
VHILALATDYDGTLALHGVVDEDTIAALQRFKETGRRLVLVTGRDLPDLKTVFPALKLFDRIVTENGAVLYNPDDQSERPLAAAPSPALVAQLRERGVTPLSVGRSIVATWEPQEKIVLEVIRELGLELQIIFNKGAVMILPSGVNKATGLTEALCELELSLHNAVGVGDAENDHAFLRACGCSAAVANALPMLKEAADIRLERDHGAGVVELAERICREDARLIPPTRQGIRVGVDAEEQPFYLQPYQGNVLITGTSGVGKSTLATALTERMVEGKFQFCIFDPEGDYIDLEDAVSEGDAKSPPQSDEALKLLRQLGTNVVVNTQHLDIAERPGFFATLLPDIASLRTRTGRPHWLLIDEAHHLMPASRADITQAIPLDLPATIFITVHPGSVLPDVLRTVEIVLAVGAAAPDVIADFCAAIGDPPPSEELPSLGPDEVLAWFRNRARPPLAIKADRPRQVHKRHTRKYAEGELGEDRSFYFRGPDGALNLRAQNLLLFLQIAEGVDDRTWEHHRKAGDYSAWFRDVIKDEGLAGEAAEIESNESLGARDSRERIKDAVLRRYTVPAREPA